MSDTGSGVTINHNLPDSAQPINPFGVHVPVLLASFSDDKKTGLRLAGAHYLNVHLACQILGMGPQTDEDQPTFIEICLEKLAESFDPVFVFAAKTAAEKEDRAAFLGISNFQHALKMANDSGALFFNGLKDTEVFQRVLKRAQKDAHNPISPFVIQAFEDPLGFPGRRFKELAQFVGGSEALARLRWEAVQELCNKLPADRRPSLEEQQAMAGYTEVKANVIMPIEPGVFPMPEEGYIEITTQEQLMSIPLSEIEERKDIQLAEDMVYPVSWHGYKNAAGYQLTLTNLRDMDDAGLDRLKTPDNQSYRDLRKQYFEHDCGLAQGLKKLVDHFGLLRFDQAMHSQPGRPDDPKIFELFSSPINSMGVDQKTNIDLPRNTADIERITWEHDAISLPDIEPSGDQMIDELKRQLSFAIFFSDRVMHGLYHPATWGQPIFVGKNLSAYLKAFVDRACEKKMSPKPFGRIAHVFTNEADRRRQEKYAWDRSLFRKSGPAPQFNLATKDDLADILGRSPEEIKFAAMFVSATTGIPEIVGGAGQLSTHLRDEGWSVTHGGGDHGGMLRLGVPYAKALGREDLPEGVMSLGVQAEPVFLKEGLPRYVREFSGDDFTSGDYNIGNGKIIGIHTHNMCERKHIMLAVAQSVGVLGGGPGTADELHLAIVSNLIYTVTEGERDLFSDYGFEPRMRPIVVVNSRITNGTEREYYDFLVEYIQNIRKDSKAVVEAMGVQFANDTRQAKNLLIGKKGMFAPARHRAAA